jgi:hypothetical protein
MMNKQIQWEDVVQLSRSGTVKSYGSNAPKPMERAVIARPSNSFTPELVRWCINPVTLVKKMNKQIQWEDVVQLSRSGTVKSYGNSPKPMERAVIVRPHDSFDKRFPIEASRIQYKRPPQKTLKRSFQKQGYFVLQMTGPVSGDDGKYYILVKYEWNKELWWKPAEDVKE